MVVWRCRPLRQTIIHVFCVKVLYWLPVVFVILILSWAHYVFVFVFNLSDDFPKSIHIIILRLTISHFLLCLHLYSYYRIIFQKHKEVPSEFELTNDQLYRLDEMVDSQPYLRELSSELPIHQVTRSGEVRYCKKCMLIKPDRTHHCSTCGRCVLKMDHHCPWVNNCVGYSNYKYFYLFLIYSVLICVCFSLSSLYDIVPIWTGKLVKEIPNQFYISFCVIVVSCLSISSFGFLCFHSYLLLVNKTMIAISSDWILVGIDFSGIVLYQHKSLYDPPRIEEGRSDKKLFNLGARRNLRTVFGSNIFLALLPVDTSEGNGTSFPIRGSHIEASYAIRRTSPSNRNGDNQNTEIHNLNEINIDASGTESEVELMNTIRRDNPSLMIYHMIII